MEKRTAVQKSIVRHGLKEIDRKYAKKGKIPYVEKALNKMKSK